MLAVYFTYYPFPFFPGNLSDIPAQAARVQAELCKILSLAEELVPKVEDVRAEQIGDMVDIEMHMTSQAIEEATAKIAVRFVYSYFEESTC